MSSVPNTTSAPNLLEGAYQEWLRRKSVMPTGAIDETVPRTISGAGAASLISGTLLIAGAVTVPGNITVSNMTVAIGAAAVTPSHSWMALARASDGLVVGKTADDVGVWPASSLTTKPLTAPYRPTIDTVLLFCVCSVAVTPFTIASIVSAVMGYAGMTNILTGNSTAGLVTPSTLGANITALTPASFNDNGYGYIS